MSLLLLDGVIPEGYDEEVADEIGNETQQGSLYALIGNPDSKCLRMHGEINNKFVQILVDGGSSHNFIQTRVAKFLGLTITPVNSIFCYSW